MEKHRFGGKWTEEKLEVLKKYLEAYTMIMKDQPFVGFHYIDAFAGSGYRTIKQDEAQSEIFPKLDTELEDFLDGSARIALKIKHKFTKYIFIEKDESRYEELKKLKIDFPELKDNIFLSKNDANEAIERICFRPKTKDFWKNNRAVLFLDPYGMEIKWSTIEAIAQTKAIDLWLLFPLGVAVNRLLRKDAQIGEGIRKRLDDFFGTSEWKTEFYHVKEEDNLFGSEAFIEKKANFSSIANYFVKRLKTIFAGVAENPLPLYNSRNNPLYLFCFAAGNPNGAPTAVKIAQDVIRKLGHGL